MLAPALALNLAVGWSFVGVGVNAWTRRPDSRTGLLMVLLGFAWLARTVGAIDAPAAYVVGIAVNSLYLGVLAHLLAGFPSGRLQTHTQRLLVGVAYLLTVPLNLMFLLVIARTGACWDCRHNLIVITPEPGPAAFDPVDLLVLAVIVVFSLALLGVVLARWRRGTSRQRRTLGPGVWGGSLILTAIVAHRVGLLVGAPAGATAVLRWASEVVLIGWPLALLLGLLRSRLDHSAVGRMIVELGDGSPVPERLQAVLARTLHDPSVELAFWLPGTLAFVDTRGRTVAVDPQAAGRAVTYVERDGRRIAVLIHDATLAAEPELVEAVVTGAALALQNEQLHAEVRAQLAEVRASRSRIVEAADTARRRVERDLHDGAQQRLVSVVLALRLARRRLVGPAGSEVAGLLEEASAELVGALAELRELARGIYPVLLTDAGLGPALASLAERSAVPAAVGEVPAGRLPGPVEQACYFVVSEALANAAKHAGAATVSIAVRERGDQVAVEVTDDGVGGADPAGSGLRGLADRVAARGGRLRVVSPEGGGTRIRAELPCG